MKLAIFATKETAEEFMKSDKFKTFDDECKIYTKQVISEAMSDLNEIERLEYIQWLTGKSSGSEFPKAHSAILWTISQGLG